MGLYRFTPDIPVLLYHGSREERQHAINRKMPKKKQTAADFPIIVTSYEIIMNDRKHLQKYSWKYIVVDEGHRLKNMNCRLIRELKTYSSANRLLLTGTPLQVSPPISLVQERLLTHCNALCYLFVHVE